MATASDNFNRSNAASLGANWTQWPTWPFSCKIFSNECRQSDSGSSGNWWNADTFGADQFSQATFRRYRVGVAVRVANVSGDANAYWFSVDSTTGNMGITKYKNNVGGTNLAGSSGNTFNSGDVLYLEIVGSNLTAKINGTTVLTASDSEFTTGQPGLWCGLDPDSALDDWSGGDVSSGTAYTLTAAQGTITLSGQTVTFRRTRVMPASQGAYTLSGQAAGLQYGRKVAAAQGAFALSGQLASLLYGRKLTAAQGSYALAGQAVAFLKGRTLTCASGTYTLSGQAAAFLRTYVLSAETGLIVLAGQNANLRKAGGSSPGDESTRRRRLIRRELGVQEPISEEDEEILFLLALSL